MQKLMKTLIVGAYATSLLLGSFVSQAAEIREAATELQQFQRELLSSNMGKARDVLEGKLAINNVGDAEKDGFLERVKPMIDKFSQEIGGQLVHMMCNEIAKIRAA